MDIEQLKLILEVMGKASEGAYVVGLIYFLQPYFSTLLTFLGCMIALIVIGVVILRVIKMGSISDSVEPIIGYSLEYKSQRERFLRELAEKWSKK